MNWEQAYREECKKLEDVRNELKEREEQICEMQLLVDKANEKLKVHFSDVVSSFEPTIEQIEQASQEYVKDRAVVGYTETTVKGRAMFVSYDFRGVLAKLKKIIGENV